MSGSVQKNLDAIATSYSERVEEHGTTAVAAGWRDTETQFLRFEQLFKIIDQDDDSFSLNDLGCGYGALLDCMPEHIQKRLQVYHGYDISSKMVEAAQEKFLDQKNYQFHNSAELEEKTDYVVASGIFNHHFDAEPDAWKEHILETLEHMHANALKGLAFNIMTTYVDFQEDYIYYCDPAEMLKDCIDRFGRNVKLVHDYPLFEFTVLIKKA